MSALWLVDCWACCSNSFVPGLPLGLALRYEGQRTRLPLCIEDALTIRAWSLE